MNYTEEYTLEQFEQDKKKLFDLIDSCEELEDQLNDDKHTIICDEFTQSIYTV